MKKYIILLILLMAFSFSKAQTILVNSNVISAHEDITFPFWLDSMSTIETGTQVVSISALEFNIVPATNGNSLVFSQTKTITSQQTVPNGKTWKITAVLLDSTAVNNSSGGQVTVNGGGNMPVALSEESGNTMFFSDAMLFCDSLQEGGYDNWVVPTFEEIMFVAGGGGSVPGQHTGQLHTSSVLNGSGTGWNFRYTITLTNGSIYKSHDGDLNYIRCVRHESIAVSSSGSSSGGSNTASTLGSGMPTMISNESANTMNFSDAMLYCEGLIENGFDDWAIPNLDQFIYAASGGATITDVRTSNPLWTRTPKPSEINHFYTLRLSGSQTTDWGQSPSLTYCRCVR
jgi:hypothetical protein